MKPDIREVAAAGLPAVVLAVAFGVVAGLLTATLEPAERATLVELLEPRVALVVMLWFVFALAGGVALHWAWKRFGVAPGRLAEQVQVLLQTDAQVELTAGGSAGSQALASAVGALVQQRAALRADIDAKVREASREVDQERGRLAALMAELTQSVVVCNLDGRILLFNSRARMQFRALVDSTGPAIGGAEAIGLGRSIYAVFDRQLVAHALESVQQRLQRGAAHPSAQFVTGTRGGQLLRVQLAPVRASASEAAPVRASVSEAAPVRASASETAPVRSPSPGTAPVDAPASGTASAPAGSPEAPLNGFVLMLDNITRDFADESERDQLLHQLTETSRASIGNLRAAVELLDDPGLDAATRERFQAVVRDEVASMSQRFSQLADRTAQKVKTRWPLEDMRGADLVAATLRRIEQQHGCRTAASEVDASLWLKVDSFSLMGALVHLAGRLVEEHGVKLIQIRLQPADGRAQLDLAWIGPGMSTETVMSWETDPIGTGSGTQTSPLSVRDVVERHAGAFWFERERVRHESFFRMLLPLADSSATTLDAAAVLRNDSRPEYYDFDLFQASEQARELADRPLASLSYTVFDTETTGLEPSAGDRILQFGATRINAGKLRRQDNFDQLVDPQRSIPPAGIPIHGITPEMVAGQPVIATVLPAFHAFAADTVLVAHNAAFDMRFLQLLEAETGIAFHQPVLDTLLLSAVVHPQQESHRLEAIAERLGVQVLGRHTALGDAMVTAEVFLKLVPLLEAMGIHTLGEALAAAQKTYFARVSY